MTGSCAPDPTWLVSQHTQELVKICQELGWLVNLEKSELEPRQIFIFCRLPVRPQVQHRTVGRTIRINTGNTVTTRLSSPAVHVSDRLLTVTATEKQVDLGLLRMRPIQWHLKIYWRVPESLKKGFQFPGPCTPTYNGG